MATLFQDLARRTLLIIGLQVGIPANQLEFANKNAILERLQEHNVKFGRNKNPTSLSTRQLQAVCNSIGVTDIAGADKNTLVKKIVEREAQDAALGQGQGQGQAPAGPLG